MNLKIMCQLLKTFGEREQIEVFFNQYIFKIIKFDTVRHLFQNISLFLPEKCLDFLLTLFVFITYPVFLMLTAFCSGSISFILNGCTVRR